MHAAARTHGPFGVIDGREHVASFHAERRVARRELALELELQDGHRLLHTREEERVAEVLPLAREALRRIVRVRRARQLLDGLERNAVALLQLRQPRVTERYSQHRRDQRLLPEARADPRSIVV